MITIEELKKQEALTEHKKQIAQAIKSDLVWQQWNTELNKLGAMLDSYGRDRYKRFQTINCIIGS
jgi:hypothetical protein